MGAVSLPDVVYAHVHQDGVGGGVACDDPRNLIHDVPHSSTREAVPDTLWDGDSSDDGITHKDEFRLD